jgi:hypothetical protein
MSEQYLAANPQQVAAKIMEGEAILINLVTGMYYSMSDTGTFIWSLVEQGASVNQIAERLTDRFDVDLPRAQADLGELVNELEAEGLITRSAQGNGALPPAACDGRSPYAVPTLEKFSDMAEMFALDPPLPRMIER